MRVGNRTDFNRVKFFIETDGIIAPREALEKSIEIMITQLKAIIGFKGDEKAVEEKTGKKIDKVKSDTIKEIKKAAKVKVTKETWSDFVNSIACNS